MRRASLALLLLALALLGTLSSPATAQREIVVRGDDQSRAVQLAREVLARRRYVLIDRDTVLPATFSAPADLVVADAEVRLEGSVAGTVAVIGGELWLRPGARVGGPIAVVDGGAYPSARATHGEIFEARASTEVAVRPDRAAGDTAGAPLALDVEVEPQPVKGRFVIVPKPSPTYDRVNGATLSAGFRFRLTRAYENPPTIGGWASYRTERGSWGGGATADLPLGNRLFLRGEASRAARTEDEWIRGDIFNSLSALLVGRDYRNYYESDRAVVMLERRSGQPQIAGETWLGPRVGLLVSRDRSLRTRDDPWALTGRDELRRPNPPIDSGTVVSALAGADVRLVGRTSLFNGDVLLERGLPGAGDFDFTHLRVQGSWEAFAFRTHELQVSFRGMGPLGGDGSPRQRYGILGGAGTLPTLEIGALRGDRLFFVSSSYAVPIPRTEVPFLGEPFIELTHATGTAWETGTRMPAWTQNVGAGVRFFLVRFRVVVDPAEEEIDPRFMVDVRFPGG